MGFFDPAQGGNPILFQHLFWFYSHPAVYIFVLPGLGVISELLPVFVRKPLFGYRWVALSSLGIALVGFLVWAHHMFAAGMEEYLRVPFMYSTLLVAVPTGVKFFSWVATIWQGRMRFQTPMLFRARRDRHLPARRDHRPDRRNGFHRPARHRHLLRRRSFPRDHVRRVYLPLLCRPLLLVPQDHRAQDERDAGQMAVLAALHRLSWSCRWARCASACWACAAASPITTRPWASRLPNLIITMAGFVVAISVLILFINLFRSARYGRSRHRQRVGVALARMANPLAHPSAQLRRRRWWSLAIRMITVWKMTGYVQL